MKLLEKIKNILKRKKVKVNLTNCEKVKEDCLTFINKVSLIKGISNLEYSSVRNGVVNSDHFSATISFNSEKSVDWESVKLEIKKLKSGSNFENLDVTIFLYQKFESVTMPNNMSLLGSCPISLSQESIRVKKSGHTFLIHGTDYFSSLK